jgi:hypothetical protein
MFLSKQRRQASAVGRNDMKRIEVDKPNATSDDCARCERSLDDAGISFDRIEQETSGAIAVYVEDEFEQVAINALRQAVFTAGDDDPPKV